MNTEDHVGKIETCSECNQQKKIGNSHSPYLKCEDCLLRELKKDGMESRRIT